MTLAQIVLLVYALVMALGGWMGHKMAKSKASLIAGVVSGALLLVALGMSFGNLAAGRWAGVAISGVLTVMFFIRVKKTKKIMPSGMLLVVSIAALGTILYEILTANSK